MVIPILKRKNVSYENKIILIVIAFIIFRLNQGKSETDNIIVNSENGSNETNKLVVQIKGQKKK